MYYVNVFCESLLLWETAKSVKYTSVSNFIDKIITYYLTSLTSSSQQRLDFLSDINVTSNCS